MFGILFHPAVAGRGATAVPAPRMTYLDNGEVRIGMDLALGGAVTFISGTILIVMGIMILTGEITRLNVEAQQFLDRLGLDFLYNI